VQIALLIDPSDESVLEFRRDRAPVPLTGSDRIDLGVILPDFDLTVEQLFAFLQ
jgi:Uma2 family endonuclease